MRRSYSESKILFFFYPRNEANEYAESDIIVIEENKFN